MTELADAAHAFIAAGFGVLRKDHVIPAPVFHPYIEVGRDYFGPEIMALPEFRTLGERLNEAHPERFADPRGRRHAEFPNTYIFSLLEACVARCAKAGDYDPASAAVGESIDEFLTVLMTPAYEVVCCRFVSHLTTSSGSEVEIGDVTVVPDHPDEFGALERRVQEEIRGAASAWNREDPRPYDPPHSLLVTRDVTDDPEPYEVARRLSGRLERFLLLARLLTSGTVQSAYEVTGSTTLVTRIRPLMSTFRKGMLDTLVRRTVRLTGDEGAAFKRLDELIDAADIVRTGMIATSFDVALSKFYRSHSADNPYEHLVDLATALEAILAGGEGDNEALTFRLRSRVAALLAADGDPVGALFDDVKELYGLRSKLVHGGQIRELDLRRIIGRVSTVPAESIETRFGVAIGYAVDRMRDLVRRSILARLCLASEPGALWPFSGDTPVDALLADDATRVAWRARWHERLAALGVESAAGPPRSAVDFLSQEDR